MVDLPWGSPVSVLFYGTLEWKLKLGINDPRFGAESLKDLQSNTFLSGEYEQQIVEATRRLKMSESTKERNFTPAMGSSRLTPLYDTAIALLTRENIWRDKLVQSVAPTENDRILDVGCGTGSLAIRLKKEATHAEIIGIDPDPAVLAIAHRKAQRAGVKIDWRQGFLDQATAANIGKVSKVVSSLVFHQTPLSEKKRILSAIKQTLAPGGSVYIADYGRQRTWLMKTLFRLTVQLFDGVEDTQPNAEGVMLDLIKEAGFIEVQETSFIRTATGSVSFYQAACPDESPMPSDD